MIAIVFNKCSKSEGPFRGALGKAITKNQEVAVDRINNIVYIGGQITNSPAIRDLVYMPSYTRDYIKSAVIMYYPKIQLKIIGTNCYGLNKDRQWQIIGYLE